MPIYDYNLTQANNDLTPPNKRKPNTLAFLGVIGYYLQYLHDLFFNNYANGYLPDFWDATLTWNVGIQTTFNNAIYECIKTSFNNPPNISPLYWIKIQNNFIGVRERAKYNSERVVLEYALNKWFKTTFRQFTSWDGSGNPTPLSDIYIVREAIDTSSFVVGVNEIESSAVYATDAEQISFVGLDFIFNKYMFSIHIPLAVYDALLPGDPSGITTSKDNVVRAFADNYILGGVTYKVVVY